ncbi:MAG: DUF3857 domain-containing protein [Candidatus Marinimicrobia bacterium]|nr:DUF3857 domain-containing protein [Candidatus Neomarinimicrobiota bacterium]
MVLFLRLLIVVPLSLLVLNCATNQVTFIRDLPSQEMLQNLAKADYSTEDAIIILDELSYKVEPSSVVVQGVSLGGLATTRAEVEIVYMLTENAVDEYGTFEFEYYEAYSNVPCGFEAHVRVLKPDGTIEIMPEESIQKVNALVDEDGTVLSRKILFKIPNLATGDILQKETVFTTPFTSSTGEIFYLNQNHMTMVKNLYITLPYYYEADYFMMPIGQIPEPKIEQISQKYGSGKTYFWSLRNMGNVHREPYSAPLQDRSKRIIFNVSSFGEWNKQLDWEKRAKAFYEAYNKEYRVTNSDYEELGLKGIKQEGLPTWKSIDSVYFQIRSQFVSNPSDYIFPQYSSFESLLKRSHAGASDMAMLMYMIMKDCGEDVEFALIRDERDGQLRQDISSYMWFDRFGISVKKGLEKRLYDFERSIPHDYEFPWFLENTIVFSAGKETYSLDKYDSGNPEPLVHEIDESHKLKVDLKSESIKCETIYALSGINATEFRGLYFDNSIEEMEEYFKDRFEEAMYKDVDSLKISEFLVESDIKIVSSGTSNFDVFFDDEFLSIAVKNYSIRNFLQNIETRNRFNHIDLKRPRTFDLRYNIEIPAGYTLKEIPQKEVKQYGGSFLGQTVFEVKGSSLEIRATFQLKKAFIPVNSYIGFYSAMLELMEQLEQPIVFEKVES